MGFLNLCGITDDWLRLCSANKLILWPKVLSPLDAELPLAMRFYKVFSYTLLMG